RRIGERDPEAAATVAGQTVWISLAVSAVVGALGVAYAPELLAAMGAEPAVVADGSAYMAFMLGGSATILLLFLVTAIFRGAGNAAIALRVLIVANAVNIVLDPCLIFGLGPFPELGVTGAAIATNIGRGIGRVYGFYVLAAGNGRCLHRVRHLALGSRVMLRLLRVSAGGVLQMIIATSSYIVLMRIVADYGSTAVAGYTIALRIVLFTLMPSWGLSNATATLVGQNLGAAQPDRAERSVWWAARCNFVFLVGIAIVFVAFARPIAGLFST